MNVVSDLTARAVSFIVLIQDTVLKSTLNRSNNRQVEVGNIFTEKFSSEFEKHINSDVLNAADFRKKAIELVWISVKPPEDKEASAANYTKCLCVKVCYYYFKISYGVEREGKFWKKISPSIYNFSGFYLFSGFFA